MPLIRYDVGDRAAMSDETCPCGRMAGLPLVRRLDGRTFERIEGRSGRFFSGGIVHFLVKSAGVLPQLREYLAVQDAVGELTLNVILMDRHDVDVAELTRRVDAAASDVFGGTVDVRCQVVDRLDRPAGRKQMYFLSRLEHAS